MREPNPTVPHTAASARHLGALVASAACPQTAEAPMINDIEATLLGYLQENYLPQGGDVRIDTSADLFDSGILDSAAVLSVIVFMENEFAITIPDEDLLPENIASVDAAVAYVRRRLDGGRTGTPNGEECRGISEEVPSLGPR